MRLRDMEAKLPADQFCHPKPCCQNRTPILGVHFWQLGFGVENCSAESLVPILGGRAHFIYCKHAQIHLLLLQRKKINASPISASWNKCQISAYNFRRLKIGAALIFLRCNNSKCICACLTILILMRRRNLVGKLGKLRSPTAKLSLHT